MLLNLGTFLHRVVKCIPSLLLAFVCIAAHSGELTVKVTGLKNTEGNLIINVYTESDDWLSLEKGAQTQQAVLDLSKFSGKDAVSHTFELPSGVYAAAAVHDIDASGDLKRNWVGMPKEPVGESGNQKGRMGPPKFEGATFELADTPVERIIKIKNFD